MSEQEILNLEQEILGIGNYYESQKTMEEFIQIGYIGKHTNNLFNISIPSMTIQNIKIYESKKTDIYYDTIYHYNKSKNSSVLIIYISSLNNYVDIYPTNCKKCCMSSISTVDGCYCGKIYDTYNVIIPIGLIKIKNE